MDHYLNSTNSYQRLYDEYMLYKSLVIAFDFDDTVYDFHKKGRVYKDVVELLRELKAANCYLICWTGQVDHDFVRTYLVNEHIPFDTINDNPPFHQSTSRKIYANVYLDDRAGLSQVYHELKKMLSNI